MKKLTYKSIMYVMLLMASAATSGLAYDTTPRMGLTAPATGQFDYPDAFDRMFHIIDSSTALQAYSNTFTSSNTFTGTGSTVTINQRLTLPYVSTDLCLAQSAGGVVGVSCSGGNSPGQLGVFNGSFGNPGTVVSSPTYAINFDSATTAGVLQGASTYYFTLRTSSVTVQGNTFNGANQLTKTDGAGRLPVSVFNSGVILSTETLQSGNTFYVSSGTAIAFNASTATIYDILQVLGNNTTGQDVVGQIAGSAFNVLANGYVGLGTAVPGYALDEQLGTVNFAYGINTTTVTVSSITVNAGGRITFPDGTIQITAAVSGTSNIAISSGSLNNSVLVSSPTAEVLFDSSTFVVSLVGSSTAYLQLNNLSSTYLTTSSAAATYLQQSSATATYLNQTTAANTYLTQSSATTTYLQQSSATATYLQQTNAVNTYLSQSSATATYLQQSSATATYLNQNTATNTYLTQSSATATYLQQSSATATYGQLTSPNTWTATQTFASSITVTSPQGTRINYGLSVGSVTVVSGSSITVSGGGNLIGLPTVPGAADAAASKAYVDASTSAGSGFLLAADNLWTGRNNWNTVRVSSFTYGVNVGSLTIRQADGNSGNVTVGNWAATAISTQYGGTGANLTGSSQGGILFMSGNGGPVTTSDSGTKGQLVVAAGNQGADVVTFISSTTFVLSTTTLLSGTVFNVASGTVTGPFNANSVSAPTVTASTTTVTKILLTGVGDGTTSQTLVTNGTNAMSWRSVPSFYTLSSDSSTTVASAVPSPLSFSVLANTTYYISCTLPFQSSVGTTGIGMGLTTPASPSLLTYQVGIPLGTDGSGSMYTGPGTSSGDMIISSSVSAINTDYIAILYGFLSNGTNAGTVTLAFQSEIGGNSVTLRAGGLCQVWITPH